MINARPSAAAIGLDFIKIAGAGIVGLDEPFAAIIGGDLVKVEGGNEPLLQLPEPRLDRDNLRLRAPYPEQSVEIGAVGSFEGAQLESARVDAGSTAN